MKKRVLHILNTSSYSGAENVAISIINKMHERVDSAYVSFDGSISILLQEKNIEFIPLKSMSISELRRVIKFFKPDIIHAHDYTASIMVSLSCVNITTISHLHNNSPWIKKYNLYSFVYLVTTLRYKKIVLVSDSILNEYVFGNYIRKKALIISNPVSISEITKDIFYLNPEKREYDILFLGRITASKNPLKFIELMKKITEILPHIRVAMGGDGELREKCEEMIIELRLQKNIKMLGFVEKPYNLLSKSRILCMTSEWEGFGLVAVEALALGLPVIATPVGGLTEIVDEECGLLTNDNSIYASEVIKLIEDNVYWNKKSLKAKEKAYLLDNIDSYIETINGIYKS